MTNTGTYTMNVETHAEGVKAWPFHLGTDKRVAESLVLERLKAGAMSVALYLDGKLVKIYDFQDIT